eukprot:gene4569-4824_t
MPRLLLGLLAVLLAQEARGQGLNDGGSLGGQFCDAARLQHYQDILELSGDYSGGRVKGRGGSGVRKGRHLLQGLLPAPPAAHGDDKVSAANMPSYATNDTCVGTHSDLEAAFHLAAAPPFYLKEQRLPWVRDQGDCASCVGHAVAACAEASLAAFTGQPALTYNFSGNSLYYCGAGGRVCGTAWSISAAMNEVTINGAILRNCQHLDNVFYGYDVRQDFDEYFQSDPTGVYRGGSACDAQDWPTCGKPFGHAILVRSLRVDCSGIGNAADTYALACQPLDKEQQQQQRMVLTPLPDRPGCYSYTVNTSTQPDLSAIAATLDINIVQLVQDNLGSAVPWVTINVTSDPIIAMLPPEEADTTAGNASVRYGCSSTPDCFKYLDLESVPVAGCLLAIDSSTGGSASCNLTLQVPNVTQPLNDGATLTVCSVPKDAFAGHDSRMSGVAVTGQTLMGAAFKGGSSSGSSTAGACVTCSDDTWKSWVGNGPCLACPAGSVARGSSPAAHDTQSDCQSSYFQMSLGQHHGCGILNSDRSLFCFARVGFEEGKPIVNEVSVPDAFKSARFSSVQVGREVTLAVLEDNSRLVAFGNNKRNQLEVPPELRNVAWLTVATPLFGQLLRCGIAAANRRLLCWSGEQTEGFPRTATAAVSKPAVQTVPLPAALQQAQFSSVVVDDGQVVGILANGSLVIMTYQNRVLPNRLVMSAVPARLARRQWRSLYRTPGYRWVMGTQPIAAAITTQGELHFLPGGFFFAPRGIKNANWQDVVANDYIACGFQAPQRQGPGARTIKLYCWKPAQRDVPAVEVPPSLWGPGDAVALLGSEVSMCAVARPLGTTQCWLNSQVFSDLANLFSYATNPAVAADLPPAHQHSHWQQVSVGPFGACAVRSADQRLTCWGAWFTGLSGGTYGRLSVPTAMAETLVADVNMYTSHNVYCVVAAQNGRVLCSVFAPKPDGPPAEPLVVRLTANDTRVFRQVFVVSDRTAGFYATVCAIQQYPDAGKLDCWDFVSSWSHAGPAPGTFQSSSARHRLPRRVLDSPVGQVVLGYKHACALLLPAGAAVVQDGGSVYCWRYAVDNDVNNKTPTELAVPASVTGSKRALAVSTSSASSCAVLSSTGFVECWEIVESRAGLAQASTLAVPVIVSNGTWQDIQAGELLYRNMPGNGHICVTSGKGKARCWTSLAQSQVNGEADVQQVLKRFGTARAVVVGEVNTCVLLAGSGDIKCIGDNTWGMAKVPK